MTAFSGTSGSHKLSNASISNITGIKNNSNNAVEYLLSSIARCSIFCLFPSPSAFIICGFIAFSTEVAINATDAYTWLAIPYAVLAITPKKLFINIAIP